MDVKKPHCEGLDVEMLRNLTSEADMSLLGEKKEVVGSQQPVIGWSLEETGARPKMKADAQMALIRTCL